MSYGAANPLDYLFKLSTQRKIPAPVFTQIEEEGPPHMKTFVWRCTFMQITAEGQGRSKKEAKTAAARAIKDGINPDQLPPPPTPVSGGGGGGGAAASAGATTTTTTTTTTLGGGQAHSGGRKRKQNIKNDDDSGSAIPEFSKATKNSKKRRRRFPDFFNKNRRRFLPFLPPPPPLPLLSSCSPLLSSPRVPPLGGSLPPVPPPVPPPLLMGSGIIPHRMTLDDHYVITKHKQIYPKDNELKVILKLVNHSEEGLRRCSDSLAIKSVLSRRSNGVKINNNEDGVTESDGVIEGVEENGEVTEEEKEEKRDVMGVARVGELAKGLLLSSDRAVNIVVMCKNKPTTDLLKAIADEMTEQLKTIAPEEDYQIHIFEEEGGFCVVSMAAGEGELPYAVNVTLTSNKIRQTTPKTEIKDADSENNNNDADDDDDDRDGEYEEFHSTDIDDPDPENMLPRKKCEQALAELRRSNWFSTMAAGLPSCVECIRIIKEMSNRDPSWNCLSDWAIELLVERALYSAHQPLSPSGSLLRVLEVIGSGLFLESIGPGIKDPCECEDVDAASNLTPQQREDLTHSAQHFIRLIAYRQIYKVLGMDKLPPKGANKKPEAILPTAQEPSPPQSQTELETSLQAGPEASSQTEPKTSSQTGPETSSQTEPETSSQTEPETSSQTEPETSSQTEPETSSLTEPETSSQTEPETSSQPTVSKSLVAKLQSEEAKQES